MSKPTSISDLLAKGSGGLTKLREGATAAERTLAAVRAALAAELATRVTGATLERGRLVVLVESAGWATRVRYAAPALAPAVASALAAPVEKVTVRVRPPSVSGSGPRKPR